MREMEEEAEKLKEMQNEVEKQMNMTSPPSTPGATSTFLTFEEKGEVDSRSVYVGNVRVKFNGLTECFCAIQKLFDFQPG